MREPAREAPLEANHIIFTVPELGWRGVPDAALLERLRGRCDVFLTIDRGFEHEHNLPLLDFGIVIVLVARNRLPYYEVLDEQINQAVSAARPGEVIHVP